MSLWNPARRPRPGRRPGPHATGPSRRSAAPRLEDLEARTLLSLAAAPEAPAATGGTASAALTAKDLVGKPKLPELPDLAG